MESITLHFVSHKRELIIYEKYSSLWRELKILTIFQKEITLTF